MSFGKKEKGLGKAEGRVQDQRSLLKGAMGEAVGQPRSNVATLLRYSLASLMEGESNVMLQRLAQGRDGAKSL